MPSRLAYLKALEIDVWERRQGAGSPSQQQSAEIVDLLPPSAPTQSQPEVAARQVELDEVSQLPWEDLKAAVLGCTRCPLHLTRTQGVFGVGDPQAQWMVIGEAPGADEDRQGEPFVGRAGQLLNSMLRAIGLKREQVFIANILKSRPPNNRDPRPEEVRACLPYLFRQI